MNKITLKHCLLAAIVLAIFGCASHHSSGYEEQPDFKDENLIEHEGGIGGTGNTDHCEEEKQENCPTP